MLEEEFTKVIGNMIKQTVLENILIVMVLNIRDLYILINYKWKNDLQNGFGKEIWPNGVLYEGEYCNGSKQGKGILKLD